MRGRPRGDAAALRGLLRATRSQPIAHLTLPRRRLLPPRRAVRASQHRDAFASSCAAVVTAISLAAAPASFADMRLPPLDSGAPRAWAGIASLCALAAAVAAAKLQSPHDPQPEMARRSRWLCRCRSQPLREGLRRQHHRPGRRGRGRAAAASQRCLLLGLTAAAQSSQQHTHGAPLGPARRGPRAARPRDRRRPPWHAPWHAPGTHPQANAVSDKTLDLRKCVYAGKSLAAKTLAGALMSDADFSKTNLQEAVLTKVRRLLGCWAAGLLGCWAAAQAGPLAGSAPGLLTDCGRPGPAGRCRRPAAPGTNALPRLRGPQRPTRAHTRPHAPAPARAAQAYAVNANFAGADLTNAVVDRVDFSGANLSSVNFTNAVVTGASFEGARRPRWRLRRAASAAHRCECRAPPAPAAPDPAPACLSAGTDLSNTIWEDALIGSQDAKKLCERRLLPAARGLSLGPRCWPGRCCASLLRRVSAGRRTCCSRSRCSCTCRAAAAARSGR